MPPTRKPKAEGLIEIQRIPIGEVTVTVEGLSPLGIHAWSEKAKKQMRDKQGGKTTQKKEPEDPQAEYESAFYRLPDGRPGIPATAFKAAIVGAARNFDALTMTMLKQSLFVEGEGPEQLVPIEGGEPEFWESPVRLSTGVADLRYRPRWQTWSCTLTVRFNAKLLSSEGVVNLIDAGGWGGVGEWRPSAPKSVTGSYGRFHVVNRT